ncbi:MAG: alanine dehydrogenase, partial [Riemerella sp.]|nr:alanine dehydrogenase [Riemerella sp.]
PYVEKHGILHSGLPNLTSKIPRTTSKAISNFFLSYLLKINEEGGLENVLKLGNDCRQGFYMYKGRHTKQLVCGKFGLKFNDINLLLL